MLELVGRWKIPAKGDEKKSEREKKKEGGREGGGKGEREAHSPFAPFCPPSLYVIYPKNLRSAFERKTGGGGEELREKLCMKDLRLNGIA